MPPLPVISATKILKILKKLGWTVDRQKGSHIIIIHKDFGYSVTIPNHDEIDRGTLKSILNSIKLTVNEFCDLLK